MHPTVFYRSDCYKLASFVKDTRELGVGFAANRVAVNDLQLVALRNIDPRDGWKQMIERNQISRGQTVQRFRILDPKLARPCTAQACQVRSTAEALAEIVRQASDIGAGRTNHTKLHQWRIQRDDVKRSDFHRHGG